MIGVALVYGGLGLVVAGAMFLIKPIKRLRIHTRRRAGAILIVGLLLLSAGAALPATEDRSPGKVALIDAVMPVWQFSEVHVRHIDAPPERVWQALHETTAGDIRFFNLLTWIRRFGRSGPESILNPPSQTPILEVALRSGFLRVAEEQFREIVLGTVVLAPPGADGGSLTVNNFALLEGPGYAKAAMNFRINPDSAGGSVLHTETRVFATDDRSRRIFARYWRVIYPGSAIIRMEWLRAVGKRAEAK